MTKIEFSSVIEGSREQVQDSMPTDTRNWVDRMFQDFNPETGESQQLSVIAHDCAEDASLGAVSTVPNSISLLVDFAANVDTANMLKGEHILVLGGNRPGRAGQGRFWVPTSQLEKMIDYLQALKKYTDEQLPSTVEQIRSNREE